MTADGCVHTADATQLDNYCVASAVCIELYLLRCFQARSVICISHRLTVVEIYIAVNASDLA